MPFNIFIYIMKKPQESQRLSLFYAISNSFSGSINMLNVPFNSPFISNLMSSFIIHHQKMSLKSLDKSVETVIIISDK